MASLFRTSTLSTFRAFRPLFVSLTSQTHYSHQYPRVYRFHILSGMSPKRSTGIKEARSSDQEVDTVKSTFQETTRPKVKRSASSSKRKAASPSSEEASDTGESKPTKKAKVDLPSEVAANGQPTNKVLPVNINFPPKTPGVIRLAAWNICGLASSSKKGFKNYVEAEDADILVLTETKVNNDPADPTLTKRYPHRYWSISEKKTYSGTAILSKIKPLSVDYTLPGHPDAKSVKGRIVNLEFDTFYVVGTYVVNAGTGLKTLPEKKEWNVHFTKYIRGLDKKKPVIWTGDLNVAPTALDLANPKTNWNKTPGYTEAETTAFAQILNPLENAKAEGAGKFLDMWRELHPKTQHYTYFSYRFNCRAKGIGWRLDTFVVSERLRERVEMCEIRSEIYGASDHCPVTLEISSDL